MTADTTVAGKPRSGSAVDFARRHLREYGILIALILIMAFFGVVTNGTLLNPLNLTNLILQNSYIVIMALGMLLVIVTGHIDLSVGSVVAFVGALAAVMMVTYEMHYLPVTIICLLVGAGIGAAQGFWVAFFKVPSFIVTLAGMLVFRGLALALLDGRSIGPFPPEFQRLSSGFIGDAFQGLAPFHATSLILAVAAATILVLLSARNRARRQKFAEEQEPFLLFLAKNAVLAAVILWLGYLLSSYRGFPNVLVVMVALIVAYTFVTMRTTVGRRIYAVGGNEKAAKLSGINTERLTFYAFVNMGLLAALAGLIFAARLNTATPKAGVSFELDVIAACFIGGASASGGVGRVTGAVIGAFIMGVMNNGMSIIGIGIDWQQVIKGLVLLAAVFLDVYNKRRA